MRNHHRQQEWLLLSLAFIISQTLLVNAHDIAEAPHGSPDPCYSAGSNATCPLLQNYSPNLFPFVTSKACAGAAPGFLLTGCAWSGFVDASADKSLGPPSVVNFSVFDPQILGNLPKNRFNDARTFGNISLTWDHSLSSQTACESSASVSNISQYLPQSINLTSFAESTFQLSSSNIILLLNCNSNDMHSSSGHDIPTLRHNSTACRSYVHGCKRDKKDSLKCYQYTPETMTELSVSKAMKSVNCGYAMFFVAKELSIPSTWRPGWIELNWSYSTPWMHANLRRCDDCLQSKGVCGYGRDGDFLCHCKYFSAPNCAAAQNHSTASVTSDSAKCKHIRCMERTIGYAVAVGFVIALSLSFTVFCIWKMKPFAKTGAAYSPSMIASWMKKPSFLWRKQDQILAKEMSYQEIAHATECFAESHIVGDGGFGAVYKGVLADGRKVAVKKLYHDNYRRMEHFLNEIKVLSTLDHPNLVNLYGFCCDDEKELLLVFEYAPQGTVSDQLHDPSKPPMPWKLRLNVACETAEALCYLHNSVDPPIYHRDVKTTNILLDEGFHAKLADFGLSKFVPLKATHVSTAPQGTPGYLDPDYHQCYQLTDKSDVYSLGVVLMELISGKLAVDMSRERGAINLSTLAIMKIQCGQWDELVDPTLQMKQSPCMERLVKRVAELAFQCLHAERDDRPTMSSVAETLAEIRRELEDDEADALVNLQNNTPTARPSCEFTGSNRLLQHSEGSACSVFFSTSSSNRSS